MPTYDYVCDACEHEFELFQSITAPVKRKCPKCARLKLTQPMWRLSSRRARLCGRLYVAMQIEMEFEAPFSMSQ